VSLGGRPWVQSSAPKMGKLILNFLMQYCHFLDKLIAKRIPCTGSLRILNIRSFYNGEGSIIRWPREGIFNI
jgi:hypothetical protein